MSVTGMPFLTKASAVTAPTGPAPTTITRSSCRIIRSNVSHYTREFAAQRYSSPRAEVSRSDLGNLEHRRMEQLLDRNLSLDQALLVQVLRQCRDLSHVLRDAVGPEIFPHDRHGLLRLRDQPRERHHERIDVQEVDHGERLGLAECLVDARRQPRILPYKLLADADEMHEGEHACFLVIGLLGFARVGKQPLDVRLPAEEGG